MSPIDLISLAQAARTLLGYLSLALVGLLAAVACSVGTSGSPAGNSKAQPSAAASPTTPGGGPGSSGSITSSDGVVTWIHIGDLHIQTTDMQNYKDFQTILQLVNQTYAAASQFAFLPGDIANEGSDAEYQAVGQAIKAASLKIPLYAVQGDHDNKSANQSFQQYIYPKTYYSQDINGYHFIFLNAMAQSGDNSLTPGSAEMTWFQNDIKAATAGGKPEVLMMHPFFFNNLADQSDFQTILQQNHVILVDTGHTHTNQLANDGHIDYAACRSTGQATEGPVGVCVETLDHGVFSWKFDPLGQFPFAEITSPGDDPIVNDAAGIAHGTTAVRAKIFDTSPISSVTYQVDGGSQVTMNDAGGDMWSAPWDSTQASNGDHKISITVKDQAGKTATDVITAVVNQTGNYTPAGNKTFGPGANVISAAGNQLLVAKGLVSAAGGGAAGRPGGPGAPGASPGAGGKPPKGSGGPAAPSPATGTVTSVAGNTVTVKLASGSIQTVTLGSGVQVVKQTTGSPSDLAPGTEIQLVAQRGQSTPSQVVIVSGAKNAGSVQPQQSILIALGSLVVGLGLGVLGTFLLRRRLVQQAR